MKKIYFIIAGGIILSVLVGFWVYSFIYGSPENSGSLFTNLGIFGQDNSIPVETPPAFEEETPVVDVATEPLRQLTTKPVVGMRLLETGSTTVMRYVEAGTGQIFDIDLTTGQETRVSQISVPVASEAVISPSGDYAAIRSGYNNQNELVLVDLTTSGNPTSIVLPNQVESFTFGFNNEFLFTEFNLGQTEGKGYMPSTKATRRLFVAPFTAHNMAWSNSSTSNHIIFTKPAATMLGYAYEVTATGLRRLTDSGYGLTLTQSNGMRFLGTQSNGSFSASVIMNDGERTTTPGATIPEKCVARSVRKNTAICASPFTITDKNFPDSWYRGEVTLDDYLWEVRTGGATMLVYPLRAVGRSLDMTRLALSPDETMVYFINKTDKTLWLYEI